MKTLWKIAATLFLLVLTLTCCGFIKKDMSTTVNKNGSVDISMTYMVDDKLANLSTGENIVIIHVDKNSPYWKTMEKRGYTVSEVKENGFTGFKATRHYDSIDSISQNYENAQGTDIALGQFFDENKLYFNKEFPLFLVKKGTFKDTYSTYIGYEFTEDDLKELEVLNDEDNTFFNLSLREKEMTLTYRVTVPNDSLVQGITPVSGPTATWTLPFGHIGAIDYSFTLYNRNFYLAIFGGIGLLVLIAGAVVVIWLIKRKKAVAVPKENDDMPAPQSPEEAAALLAFVSGKTDTPPSETMQPRPQAPVAQPQPQAPVAQPRPQAPVAQPRPQAPVAQPRPQAPVAQPRPQAPVAQPRPQAPVAQPRPQAPVAQPRPQAPVAQPQPQAPVAQPQPQAPVAQPRPQAPVAQPQPQAPVAQPRPQAPVAQPRPQAPVAQPRPQAPVARPQPQAQAPTCPHCGSKLTVRISNTGDAFMVCENYPTTCKFSTPL